MCVVDEVAALPDGQALAAMAEQVQGSPADVYDLASRWSKAASDATASAAAVRGTVMRVGETWLGGSNAGFTDFMSQFDRASDLTQRSLSNASETLTQLALAFEQAQSSITSILENLLTQVSQIRAVSPGDPTADEQIRVLVSQATQEADAVITTLESALNQASTVLGAELPGLSTTFSALPQPGGPDPVQGGPVNGVQTLIANVPTGGGTVPIDNSAVPPTVSTSGGSSVDDWISEATRTLVASGVPASQLSPQDLALIIQHESGGDPSAVNNWDGNAAAGTPSIGLMQTIQPTFDANALPGHGDIRNPVDNIIAGTRYALARYGSLSNVPGVVAVHNGQPYVGY